MKRRAASVLLVLTVMVLTLVARSGSLLASAPAGKLVMLDVDKLSNVTSKRDPDNTHLAWRELVDAGINGVHFRSWTNSGDSDAYTQAEWVAEAHEYGLWVCGGTGSDHPVADMATDAQNLASMGVDFIQLDEPMGFGLTEAGYNTIRNAAHAVDASVPVIITDVFYNSTIASWSAVDGLAQEVYIDDWYGNIDQAVAYQSSHPGQQVMMWVWLPVRLVYPEDPCTSLPDSKFDLWFGDSFDKVGKTLLFIFQARDPGGDACSWATNWNSRVATISAKTAGYRVSLPEWDGFTATGTEDGSPDCTVSVRSPGAGLDPGSVRASYSVDGGATWSSWTEVDCTGSPGTTEWQTITAHDVPFHQASSTLNQVRFHITDTYSGSYYRSARSDKMVYTVSIEGMLDGGAVEVDAGPWDPDAQAGGKDGGNGADDPSLSGGCGCRASGPGSAGRFAAELALGLLLLVLARRRRCATRRTDPAGRR